MKFLEQCEEKDWWIGQYCNKRNLITYIGGGDQININSTALSAKIEMLRRFIKDRRGYVMGYSTMMIWMLPGISSVTLTAS